jgi:hypothetical protein
MTDAAGAYRMRLRSSSPPGEACLRVHVTPPAGAGLGEVTAEGARVEFRSDHRGGALASVRVDVELPPAP